MNKEKDSCNCIKYETGSYKLNEVGKDLNIISSSLWKLSGEFGEFVQTHLIGCKKNCGNYFLWDQHSIKYKESDKIELHKLNIEILNPKEMGMIMGNLEGIVSEKDLNEFIEIKKMLNKEELALKTKRN